MHTITNTGQRRADPRQQPRKQQQATQLQQAIVKLSASYPQAISKLSASYRHTIVKLSASYRQAIVKLSASYRQAIVTLSAHHRKLLAQTLTQPFLQLLGACEFIRRDIEHFQMRQGGD
jgi:hypothetical protein